MDGSLLVLDLRFTLNQCSVRELRVQPYVLERGWQHPTADVQHVGRFNDRPLEAAGDLGQCSDKQVPEGMPIELGPSLGKSVLKEARHQGLVVGQRDETVPDVTWRGNVVGSADLTRAPTIVCHRDDGGDRDVVPFQTTEEGREAGSPTYRDDIDFRPAQAEAMFGDD